MSLVDYASSDEEVPDVEEEEQERDKAEGAKPDPSPPPPPVVARKSESASVSLQQQGNVEPFTVPPIEKLPDASLLFSTPSVSSALSSSNDHASRVAAAMAESASRKRDSNVLPSAAPRGKLPRGKLPHMKNVPETVGGLLVPPQLSGRSNIVTEDISKLFVKRQADPSSE